MLKCALNFSFPFLLLTSVNAFATVLVNAPPPYAQRVNTDTSTFDYYIAAVDGATGFPAGVYFANVPVNGASFPHRLIDASIGSTVIYFDVSSTATIAAPTTAGSNSREVVTLSTSSSGSGSEIPIQGATSFTTVTDQPPGACTQAGGCGTGSRNGVSPFSAFYTQGQILRVGFTLDDLCANSGGAGTTQNLCTGTSVNNAALDSAATLSIQITVSFSNIDITNPATIGTIGGESMTFNLHLTNVPPTVTRPSSNNIQDFYYPGSGSMIITPGSYNPDGAGNAPIDSVIVMADPFPSAAPTITADGAPRASIVQFVPPTGQQIISGFINTTSGTDHGYSASISAMNVAGIYSNSTDASPAGVAGGIVVTPFPSCVSCATNNTGRDGLVRAQQVNSVLTDSKCFIATAAFHDGHAAPVMMLRKFRDKILAKHSWGRDFIQTYYTYSPPLAQWAWDKPMIRSIALHALAPVEFMAWAILKLTHAAEVSSPQPYIDRVKKQMDGDQPTEKYESYTESLKKKLSPAPTPGAYIQHLKEINPNTVPTASDESSGYTDRIKKTLPSKDDESVIANVKAGKDKKKLADRPPITTAVGIEFGVNPGVSVVNKKGTVSFSDMYGGTWQPDLNLHYEHEWFHSETLGSFGIGVDLGLSYAEGYGIYTFPFGSNDSKKSVSKFSFLQVPVLVNAVYRFNLFHAIRPYGSIGAGSMGYAEFHHDNTPDKRGYSPIYELKAGAALLLDGIDSSTSNDGFLSDGIQHSYLYAEYRLMRTLTGDVTFERSGMYLGFLFEY